MSLQLFKHNMFVQRLLDQEIVTDNQLEEALELRKTTMQGCDLLTILVARGYVNLGHVCQDLAERFELEFVKLSEHEIPSAVIALVDPRVARFYRIVPLKVENDALIVASDDPTNISIFKSLGSSLGRTVLPAVAEPDEISAALNTYYP